MFLLMGLCFGLSAFGLIGGAVWAYLKQQRTMQSQIEATGTVVDLHRQVSNRGYIFCPVIEFTIPSGEAIRFTSGFGSYPAHDKVGDVVKVRYDANDPHKAEVDSALSNWLTPLILGFMGVIACCLGTVFLAFFAAGVSP